jgi:hypothetical protein
LEYSDTLSFTDEPDYDYLVSLFETVLDNLDNPMLVDNDEPNIDPIYDYPFCGLELVYKPKPKEILKKVGLATVSSDSDDKFGYGKDFCVGGNNIGDIVDKKVKAAQKMRDEIKEIDAQVKKEVAQNPFIIDEKEDPLKIDDKENPFLDS